jgi:hypothetical protein
MVMCNLGFRAVATSYVAAVPCFDVGIHCSRSCIAVRDTPRCGGCYSVGRNAGSTAAMIVAVASADTLSENLRTAIL